MSVGRPSEVRGGLVIMAPRSNRLEHTHAGMDSYGGRFIRSFSVVAAAWNRTVKVDERWQC